ncbi:3-deoxy-manno-octulosonate cytidylyltransferase [Pseudomonadota bacterium]|jgi:3-deoxy-manno-octulosonate cytidylyltransferase (CMP-KDO synthetase)|nr:3-deoxy-manno-octulosonate cytidylyltransferase [Pseudomonadota bacterium]MDC0080215.1 3-deoxy-manno-octulosonate cytidylyltransferase [Pseudomonadota bacterium]|tara:strand:- start:404 stop:1141 length:738 start_codon:yes stop_codon:yes gene_type:complete
MTDSFAIMVPARAGSTRLPNKPLANINGKTVISRIIDLALSSNASNVYIATDSDEIKDHCESSGVNVVMTSSSHISGMDRIAEAAKTLDLPDDIPIVNLQGDEPFMPIEIINQLPMLLSDDVLISTACIKFTKNMDFNSPHEVKVVRSVSKTAIYFSRSVIPNPSNPGSQNHLKHLGIYAYTNKTLQALSALKPTANEESEKLEQLRFLDNGFDIFVQDFKCEAPIGIDTPEDLEAARAFAKKND